MKFLLISAGYWTAFTMLLVTVRFLGIEFFIGEELKFPLRLIYLNSLPGGILMGVLWVVIDRLLSRYFLTRARTFGTVVMVMTFTYITIIGIVIFLATWLISGSLNYAVEYSFHKVSIGNISFTLVGAFILVFFQKLDQRVGPGTLYKYLTGKYFKPREEERIFIFMDLNSSTSIAENIGHKQYSRFVQDCYRLLTEPLKATWGEVYQYVGDEVVVSWEVNGELSDTGCLDFYFAYNDSLTSQALYFEEHYGRVPEFKAAVHIGYAMVAEVGQLKSEIAFHGDVLNTTARVLGFCHKLNESLLITESLISRLPINSKYSYSPHGPISLKGKEGQISIFGVSKS